MGDSAQSSQPVFYDASTGQYYTQAPTNNSPFAGVFNNGQLNQMNGGYGQQNSWLSSLFGAGGQRNYITGLTNKSPLDALIASNANMKTNAPSLAELFPSLYGSSDASGVGGSLIGSQTPSTGATSSGAGRFM